MNHNYLFKSNRLGFRNWCHLDIPKMIEINSDVEVMAFFPHVATANETMEFVERMIDMFTSKGFCYYAVDELETASFIGFIGLCEQTYEALFTPCVDIGWRLNKKYWNRGYATEGAKKCLEQGFNLLGLKSIK